jgi:hypothetical protein
MLYLNQLKFWFSVKSFLYEIALNENDADSEASKIFETINNANA